MSKYIIEVVHAGISSLKINVKGRKGVEKKTIAYGYTRRLRTAKESKVVQGDLPHTHLANWGQISYTPSVECKV